MYCGFPLKLISRLRCQHDSGVLVLRPEADVQPGYVRDAMLQCESCGRQYAIEDGIVHFLDPDSLDSESNNERLCRDMQAAGLDAASELTAWNRMEIEPTMAASEPLAGALVLELGAGTGRHTVHMARRGASIIAVDFSARSLEHLAARAQTGWDIGLVHADCTRLALAPREFDLVASTLVSNLPTVQHRAAMMRIAAAACSSAGKFVFGTHHYGIRSRFNRAPRSGHYPGAPIYRYLFRRGEIEAETRSYFTEITCHPIQIRIPLAERMRLPIVKLSRLTERVPLINELGELLLVIATRPRNVPAGPGDRAAAAHQGLSAR